MRKFPRIYWLVILFEFFERGAYYGMLSILSVYLTNKVLQANQEFMKIGFQPYISSAVSSGTLSLLALMEGQWHYSSSFLGGIYWGSRNRQTPVGLEWEQFDLSPELSKDLKESYQSLKRKVRYGKK